MPSLFAPPELFSAFAVAQDGSDPDLARGTHLRVYAGLGASFPLTPFIVYRVRSHPSEPRGLHVVDREGRPVGRGLDLSEVDLAEATLLLPDSDTERTVRVDLRPAHERALEGALLLDQRNRVIMERNGPLWLFAAPVLHKLLVRGRGAPIGIRTRAVSIEDITDDRPHEPGVVLGLPVHGAHPWYVGVQDPEHRRVALTYALVIGIARERDVVNRDDGGTRAAKGHGVLRVHERRAEAPQSHGSSGGSLQSRRARRRGRARQGHARRLPARRWARSDGADHGP